MSHIKEQLADLLHLYYKFSPPDMDIAGKLYRLGATAQQLIDYDCGRDSEHVQVLQDVENINRFLDDHHEVLQGLADTTQDEDKVVLLKLHQEEGE